MIDAYAAKVNQAGPVRQWTTTDLDYPNVKSIGMTCCFYGDAVMGSQLSIKDISEIELGQFVRLFF